jgi:hypothetical protein
MVQELEIRTNCSSLTVPIQININKISIDGVLYNMDYLIKSDRSDKRFLRLEGVTQGMIIKLFEN